MQAFALPRLLVLLAIAASRSPGAFADALGRPPYLPGSVVVRLDRTSVNQEPTDRSGRRGTVAGGQRLPAYRFAEGNGCGSWWVEVYSDAWICGDYLSASASPPDAAALPVLPDDQITPYPCAFAGEGGAPIYDRLADAVIDYSERWLEQGWAIAVRKRVYYEGQRFYGTAGSDYVRSTDVYLARPSMFQGELLSGPEDLGWTFRGTTRVFEQLPTTARSSFRSLSVQTPLRFATEVEVEGTTYLQLVDGGYVRASDVRRAEYLPPPEEVGPFDVWFDVDREHQVLVVYRGLVPIYATLVSSGRPGHETHAGTFRIWAKLITDRMANEEPSDPDEKPYYLEDVPWVMYFDEDIALHGAYWHKAFGHVRSHGCVNLAPLDARWVFDHAQPALPRGWWNVLPTETDPGSLVRVR
jgi:hypothetical protein